MSRIFALVTGTQVVNIAVAGDAGVFVGYTYAIDVSNRNPQPECWWTYDPWTDTFAPPPAFSRTEAVVKAEAIARVNTLAGACRSKYLTVVPGQAETYLLKADELRAYDAVVDANGTPDPADYPILATEATTTNATLDDVVTLVRQTRAAWLQLAAVVEGMRRGAIVTIENALNEADVLSAIPENWP